MGVTNAFYIFISKKNILKNATVSNEPVYFNNEKNLEANR